MARSTLTELVRRVLTASFAVGGATSSADALPGNDIPSDAPNDQPAAAVDESGGRDLILRAARPKVLLRATGPSTVSLFSSHRSHRSHSSHRSSSSAPPPTRPPTQAPSQRPTVAAVKPVLGSRVLLLGMNGADVEELLLLLVKKNLLTADRIPSDATFNANMETAVKTFQAAKGITVDGRVDFRTLLLLKAQ